MSPLLFLLLLRLDLHWRFRSLLRWRSRDRTCHDDRHRHSYLLPFCLLCVSLGFGQLQKRSRSKCCPTFLNVLPCAGPLATLHPCPKQLALAFAYMCSNYCDSASCATANVVLGITIVEVGRMSGFRREGSQAFVQRRSCLPAKFVHLPGPVQHTAVLAVRTCSEQLAQGAGAGVRLGLVFYCMELGEPWGA